MEGSSGELRISTLEVILFHTTETEVALFLLMLLWKKKPFRIPLSAI